MNRIDLKNIENELLKCEIVLDKWGRIAYGVNQSRKVLYDRNRNLYYKIFDKEYCRRENFIRAVKAVYF